MIAPVVPQVTDINESTVAVSLNFTHAQIKSVFNRLNNSAVPKSVRDLQKSSSESNKMTADKMRDALLIAEAKGIVRIAGTGYEYVPSMSVEAAVNLFFLSL